MKRPHRIRVKAPSLAYDVVIGSGHLSRLGGLVRRLALGFHAVVLTNETLRSTHAKAVSQAFRRSGFEVAMLTIADTERSKSFQTLGRLLVSLAALDRPGRRPFLVLVGGGVVGDVGGMLAGIYRRGIPYIQVPTTLLAQVDSAIGGKTAIDLPQGKNLAGLFYQPSLVFVELRFLRSLPPRQFRSGLSEIMKCGVIRDRPLFEFLEQHSPAALSKEQNLAWIIERAIRVKADIVAKDEKETCGIRSMLNFGHTLGHALEAATHYAGVYTHGEAVALGMIAASRISRALKLIAPSQAARIELLLRRFGLPTTVRRISAAQIFGHMAHDKKWAAVPGRWVLPTGLGRAVVRDGVGEALVKSVVAGMREG